MSSSRTRKSTSRTSRGQKIHLIILEISRNGGDRELRLKLPPSLAGNTLLYIHEALQDGTLKYCAPLSVTTEGNGVYRFPLSWLSRLVPAPEPAGSYEKRLRAYYEAHGIPRIFADLSLLGYTRDFDPETS